MPTPMIRIEFAANQELYAILVTLAERRGTTISQVLRDGVLALQAAATK